MKIDTAGIIVVAEVEVGAEAEATAKIAIEDTVGVEVEAEVEVEVLKLILVLHLLATTIRLNVSFHLQDSANQKTRRIIVLDKRLKEGKTAQKDCHSMTVVLFHQTIWMVTHYRHSSLSYD